MQVIMEFNPPLVAGTLQRRYQRFLADVTLADGHTCTVHCSNTGSLRTVLAPPQPAWLSPTPHNTLPYRLLALGNNADTWVGVYPALANTLIAEALATQTLAPFQAYPQWRAEVELLPGHRADFLLQTATGQPHWLEVKSVSMATAGVAQFPDSVSTRATKHLVGLHHKLQAGEGASVVFVVQRADCHTFRPAAALDPAFAAALQAAQAAGLGVYAYGCHLTQKGIALGPRLQVNI